MDKAIYKSKTIIGFGVAIVSLLATQLGILNPSTTLNIVQTLAAALGIYGLRSAI